MIREVGEWIGASAAGRDIGEWRALNPVTTGRGRDRV